MFMQRDKHEREKWLARRLISPRNHDERDHPEFTDNLTELKVISIEASELAESPHINYQGSRVHRL